MVLLPHRGFQLRSALSSALGDLRPFLFADYVVNSTNGFSCYYASASNRPRRRPLSRNDKIAILGSVMLLLAIIAAGGLGLSKAYRYNEPAPEAEAKGR